MKKLVVICIFMFQWNSYAQEINFEHGDISNASTIALQMQKIAQELSTQTLQQEDLYRTQIISEKYSEAMTTIDNLYESSSEDAQLFLNFYKLYAKAKATGNFESSFKDLYTFYLKSSDDIHVIKLHVSMIIREQSDWYKTDFERYYKNISSGILSAEMAQELINKYFFSNVFSETKELVAEAIMKDHERRYEIDDSIRISTEDGAEISAVLVNRKGEKQYKKSTLLAYTIYAEDTPLWAMLSASKGYVGMIAYTRGKVKSSSEIVPLEYENTDVYEVIDWINKQPWSSKKVGMYGGSYDGFSQWASMKHKVHPALKTIVPMVAIAPGIDYPMENNVLHNYSYSWNFYVTNNKYLDHEAANDFNRWNSLKNTWYTSGVAFQKLDSLDGEENKLWNTYMQHPSYDTYWKQMIPYKEEFSKIDIPILTITGYYDDSQRGAMYYYNEHHKYSTNSNHYLVVGPYDHWTAQNEPQEYLRGYKLDKTAAINIRYNLMFEWFDYILKDGQKPEILKDKVNFQVMNSDTWMHKPNVSAMTNDTLTFHLSDDKSDDFYALKPAPNDSEIGLQIDFKDRNSMSNTEYYPWPLERENINMQDGLLFRSEILQKDVIVNGSFFGDLEFTMNKKDVDYSVIAYQQTPEGNFFHLSYYIGRASYAKDRENRQLITPNKKTQVAFDNSKLISKKISQGSRIVFVVNVNKNNNAQINYGTGKDVNTENITNAGIPLEISFTGQSSISLPIWRYSEE